ncbi:MAG: carbohydrate porin [Alphaproteobacteria bacterium]|nr:carbohydrate porin [Alphaproteobacteria bacterium]
MSDRWLRRHRHTSLPNTRRAGSVAFALGALSVSAGLCAGPALAQSTAGAIAASQPASPEASSDSGPLRPSELGILVAQAAPQEGDAASAPGTGGFFNGIMQRSNLLGDIFGLRPFLYRYGISFGLQEVSEVMGNVTGGITRGTTYDGLTTMSLGLDTSKALGWEGGTFNISALQIHGRSLSQNYLDNLQTASGIEATRATRLWELWYQQAFHDGDFDVKIGQQSLDQEFMVSQYAGLFVNTMFGWPMVPSADLPSGGPAYPLSSLGVRLRGKPSDSVTLLAGVFNDNPAGPGTGDPQVRNASGTNFRLSDSPLVIAELQYAINQPALGEMDYGDKEPGLPGTYRLGAWYDDGLFADQEFDTTGLSLADPSSNGTPRQHRGNFSLYGVFDQQIWRPDPTSGNGIGVFMRAMGAPADRNQITFSLNAGITAKGLIPGRDNDTLGLGYGYAGVSSRLAQFDRDSGNPARTSESFIELTYQYQYTPWWQIQPDFQYIFNPGGGIPNPSNPSQLIHDEAVLGLRTTITF